MGHVWGPPEFCHDYEEVTTEWNKESVAEGHRAYIGRCPVTGVSVDLSITTYVDDVGKQIEHKA
eukprot:1560566-Lingulodinium_polyedra.AAC.1